MDHAPLHEDASGLSTFEAAARLARYGPNVLPRPRGRSAWAVLAAQLRSFLVVLLLVAAGVALLLGEWAQGLAILGALAINAGVGFALEFQAERVIASLAGVTTPSARVRRDGRELRLPAAALVPGDVVLLAAGDRVPADALLLAGECLADESLLTGESVPATKGYCSGDGDLAGSVFAGTLLTSGRAVARVRATGSTTEVGRIGSLLAETRRPPSPLDERLAALGNVLIWTVAGLWALLVGLGLWQGRSLAPLLQTAIALAVAAIPEGLPSVATLALAAGVRRLQGEGIRVRHLGALEALGGITVLCFDKTGTLTVNAMTVEEIALPHRAIRVTGTGWSSEGILLAGGVPVRAADEPALAAFLEAAVLSSEAVLAEPSGDGHREVPCLGDPSECALLVVARKAGMRDTRDEWVEVRTAPPGPDRPWMHSLRRRGQHERAFVKGAPEAILAMCAAGAGESADWLARAAAMAGRGLRVFAIAASSDGRSELRCLGLAGMRDPPRPDAREALRAAHGAGIRTVMMTGDHPATALAIARDLDLAGGRPPRAGSDAGADVYARATPAGKHRLVKDLQAAGEVVAMTGDGVNDAPALRAAAVGVAMGRGTEVARDAASVVLVEGSLSSLLRGIHEGRGAFCNVQKAVDYLLTCSFATLLTVLLVSVAGLPLPLGPLQILYLNLLMHTFPALGLALEAAPPDLMSRPPLPRQAWLLSPARLALILWHGLVIAMTTLAVVSWGIAQHGVDHGRTVAFAVLAGSLLVHALADRSRRAFGGWRWERGSALPGFLAIAAALLAAALYFPPLAGLLEVTGMAWHDWSTAAVAIALAAVAVELSKAAIGSSFS